MRRIPIRPRSYVSLLVALLVGLAFFIGAVAVTVSRREVGSALFLSVWLVAGLYAARVVWRGSQIAVSMRGVSLPPGLGLGLFRWEWLPWSEIAGFERAEPTRETAIAPQIIAKTIRGDAVVVCGVAYQPLMLDTRERHRRAVERVIELLENERLVQTNAREGPRCAFPGANGNDVSLGGYPGSEPGGFETRPVVGD